MSDAEFLERLEQKLCSAGDAVTSDHDEEEAGDSSYLKVRLGPEHFLVPVATIEEVVLPPEVTSIPRVKEQLRGIFMYRGALVPLLDTAALIGIADDQEDPNSKTGRTVIVGTGGDLVGLEVSEVAGVIEIAGELWESPQTGTMRFVHQTTRLEETLAGLLDVHEILSMPKSQMVAEESPEM